MEKKHSLFFHVVYLPDFGSQTSHVKCFMLYVLIKGRKQNIEQHKTTMKVFTEIYCIKMKIYTKYNMVSHRSETYIEEYLSF